MQDTATRHKPPQHGTTRAHLHALTHFAWLAPLAVHAPDAHAWGLHTHMYFAQLLIWAVPLSDVRFRRALMRFPELCLAATCLPDVSLFTRPLRAEVLRTTHQWSAAKAMLRNAATDTERAMAAGFAAHLLTDIVAHNSFVPAHETIWFRAPTVTHAFSEWAMDAHVSRQLFVEPAKLIRAHRDVLVTYAGAHLGFGRSVAWRALDCLMRGECALRRSRLPHCVYWIGRRADPSLDSRFDHYIRETSGRLRQINKLIAGDTPVWLPELADTQRSWIDKCGSSLNHPLFPADLFHDATAG